jgi:outer membrane receptor protein involved in Fe transport
LSTAAAAAGLHGTAMAQSVADEAVATSAGGEVEAITVVGSQIRGAKVTGALPVAVVGQDDIQAVGAVSAGELFRALPQAGDVSFNEQTLGGGSPNAARGDVSSITLRGLGQGNTLLLLNGRRVVVHPTTQTDAAGAPVFGFNVNAIPLAGLARVEVLRDGAAALYGSDAVAGVVNNVLRDNITGVTVEAQYGGVEGTGRREFQFSTLAGTDFAGGRGNISAFFGYTNYTDLKNADQDYTATADRRFLAAGTSFEGNTSFDGRSTASPWGGFQAIGAGGAIRSGTTALTNASGQFHIQPTSSAGCQLAIGNGLCIDDGTLTGAADRDIRLDGPRTYPDLTVLPSLERFNAFTFINYDLTDDVRFFSELGYYTAKTHAVVGSSGPLASTPITIPAGNYYNPFGPVGSPNRLPNLNIPASGLPLLINNYSFVDTGSRSVDVKNVQYRLLAGLRGELWGWNWEGAALYNKATVDDVSDALSNRLAQLALARTTPDAYNPFNGGDVSAPGVGDPTPAADLSSFRIKSKRANRASLALADLKLSKPDLVNLWAGPIGVAAGVEIRRETYGDDRDAAQDASTPYTNIVTGITYGSDLMGASPSPDVSGKRTVTSAFAELAVPVVSPDMGVPLVRAIDLQLAGRYEHYSDVGGTAKPKVAGSWDLFDGVRARASWSQGFRAPNLETLNSPVLERSNTGVDYVLCEADLRARRITSFATCSRNIPVVRVYAGNPDLQPEESESFSYGAVLEAKFLPVEYGALTFTIDRWKIDQLSTIGVFEYQNALTLDYLMRVQGQTNPAVVRAAPTAEDIANVAGTGLAPAGTVLSVNAVFENLNPRTVEGLDIGVDYRLRGTPLGDFSLNFNLAKLIKFYQSPSPDQQALIDAQRAGLINVGVAIPGAADLIRDAGRPKYRWSATFTWTYGPVQVGLFTQYIGDVYETGVVNSAGQTWVVGHQQTFNAYAQYEFGDAGLARNTTIRFGVRNLTDKDPPIASGGYLASLYQPYARYWYGSVRKSF